MVYHENRASTIRISSLTDHTTIERERGVVYARHVSVIYISVRLIISATWVRQIPLSFDLETAANVDNKVNRDSRGTDESFLHENLFVFDKAFAQEIRYLFAELDFDLYMCRDKKGKLKKPQAVSRRFPAWRPKEQHQTFVYFVRQNGRNNGLISKERDNKVGEYTEQFDLQRVLETFSDKMKIDGRYPQNCSEEYQDISVEDYLQQFEEEDAKGEMSKNLCDREDMTIDEFLRLCEEERLNKDITVEEYLKLFDNKQSSGDITIEEYLKACEEMRCKQDITVEEYLRLCEEEQVNRDMTIEEYLLLCREEECTQDMSVEEYLRLCEKARGNKDISVEEYLRLCETELSKDMTVEEYLRSYEEDQDNYGMKLEEYLRLCQEEQYLRDMTVEEYLRMCEEEQRARGMTVEEYLKLCEEEQMTRGMTIEEYLKLCEEERRTRGMTVEEYLKLCEEERRTRGMTVEEYLKLCEEERRTRGMTVEEYLKLCEEERRTRGMTVEEYLKLCEEERRTRGMTVEEYLKLCEEEQITRGMTVEEYLKLCRDERRKSDITVEEYLELCKEEDTLKGMTVEQYLQMHKNEQTSEIVTSQDVTVEEYLFLHEKEKQKEDTTVEEYLRRFEEEKEGEDLTIEEYLRLCELEQSKDLSVEEYLRQCQQDRNDWDKCKDEVQESEIWDAFKSRLYFDFNSEANECHKISEEALLTVDANKQLGTEKGMDLSEGDRVGHVGSLSLQAILVDDQVDDCLGASSVEGQTRCHLEVEAEEEEITESAAAQAESSVDDWMSFDAIGIDDEDDTCEERRVEEDLVSEFYATQSNENDMAVILQRYGLIYSAELWLLFPPFRRTPWTHISVMCRDDVLFDWRISKVVETEANDTLAIEDSEMRIALDEEAVDISSADISEHQFVEEDEVRASKVAANFAEIEFSFLDSLDDSYSNNNSTTHEGVYPDEGETNIEDRRLSTQASKKKMIPPLMEVSLHVSDEQVKNSGSSHFAPLTNLSKKGLVYKSKERIFTGSEKETKSVWNSLEKLHCKHAKTISVPETLRRTISKNRLDILEPSIEDESEGQARQENENEVASTLQLSPLRFDNFGKNLRESNV